MLEREFRRVPRIVDVTSSGGTVKRYEIHPDPDRLKRYGITLAQLQTALHTTPTRTSAATASVQGDVAMSVRSVGLFGGGEDPVQQGAGHEGPRPRGGQGPARGRKGGLPDAPMLKEMQRRRLATAAAAKLREEEKRRFWRSATSSLRPSTTAPIRVEDVVEGGRLAPGEPRRRRSGVVVGHQTRLGKVSAEQARRDSPHGHGRSIAWWTPPASWSGATKTTRCSASCCCARARTRCRRSKDVEKKVEELNDPESGRMLPGVEIEPYYDRTELINVTTDTVRENLLVGMVLVIVILLMFLSNVRSAVIVAINIPLALLFAFSVLYLRGKSANLLSIGAVDFGIIVDSSVIMVENIYRHLQLRRARRPAAQGAHPPRLRARSTRPLFFSTLIMVCAFIPLFTMQGPEGQLFGPMAETYAFALGGALLLALTAGAGAVPAASSSNLKPAEDNFLVRCLKHTLPAAARPLCLKHRWMTLVVLRAA